MTPIIRSAMFVFDRAPREAEAWTLLQTVAFAFGTSLVLWAAIIVAARQALHV